VTVRGGYSPDLIRVRQGVPLRIVFDRQEGGECTSRVVFPDFAVNQPLPASARTTVRFVPDRAGEFGFACGMNVVLGTLVVEPAAPGRQVPPARGEPAGPAAGFPPAVPEPAAEVAEAIGATETGEAAERRAEIADLTRRVGVGAVLTAPSCSRSWPAVCFRSGPLGNHWVELALITPVMRYSGWPIHRTGWSSLAHRSAEMNPVITIGTWAAFGYSRFGDGRPEHPVPRPGRRLLRGGGDDHHAHPAGPALGGPSQGRHGRGDPEADGLQA
jgi:Cu+-exporting ATPase